MRGVSDSWHSQISPAADRDVSCNGSEDRESYLKWPYYPFCIVMWNPMFVPVLVRLDYSLLILGVAFKHTFVLSEVLRSRKYLPHLFHCQSSHVLQAVGEALRVVLSAKEPRPMKTLCRGFSVEALLFWNCLPLDIFQDLSLLSFRRHDGTVSACF